MRLQVAALAVLTGTALALPAAPAVAAACSQGSGVTVVVDFASLGGGQQVRCTDTDPASGIAALRQAGFTPTRAAQVPGYFLCRIDGKPANDPCQRTSPEEAYWSYWHAKPGGSWSYSSGGANDYDPPPGSVEGWAFGAGDPPSAPPPRAATPRATRASSPPATTARPTPAPVPSRKPSSAVAATPAPAGSIASTAPSTSSPLALDPSQPPPTDPAPATSAAAALPAGDSSAAAQGGGASGALLAAGIVALLVAAGASTVLRRRRDERV